MVICHGSLMLRTITPNDLEVMRAWRNSETVNKYLINQVVISFEAQQKWYGALDSTTSIYFMMLVNSKKVGIVYAHNIDVAEKSFEGSIFVGNPDFANSFVPVKAALVLTNLFFENFGFNTAYSTVHMYNRNALELDKKLGYKEISKHLPFIKSRCTKEDFVTTNATKFKTLFTLEKTTVCFDAEDLKYPFAMKM